MPIPASNSKTVAVIDVGSNSIKVLVAARSVNGSVQGLKYRTIDARISAGISRAVPRLSEEGMVRGVDAIRSLFAEAEAFAPTRILLVATSAVRDAQNGGEFCERVRATTGHSIRILSGEEEANLIGRGLGCDPELTALRDFYVFDLGGGSLECLAFLDRHIRQVASLQLGCVRLSEKFPSDADGIFPRQARDAVTKHTREAIAHSGFRFSLPATAVAVGTGGSLTTVRTVFAARRGQAIEDTSPVIPLSELRELLDWLAPMPISHRRQIAGLPPARADVFPTALATALALAEAGGFDAFRNSVYNLRYGVAAEALA